MRIVLSLCALLLVSFAKAQTIHNNNAVKNGNWDSCETWNFPNSIFNSAQNEEYYKTIRKDIIVTQNLPLVYANKINLSNGSKIILADTNNSGNKISFSGSGNPITPNPSCPTEPYIDNVFIDFNDSILNTKSLSGFLLGLNNWEEAREPDPNLHDTYPLYDTQNKITPLKPKLTRQRRPQKYQLGYDLTRTLNSAQQEIESGRVHMILSDSWANRCWNSTTNSGGFPYENEFPNLPIGISPDAIESYCEHCYIPRTDTINGQLVTFPCGIFKGYKEVPTTDGLGVNGNAETKYLALLDKWFAWGNEPDTHGHSYKPGIVWECWNEPDWYEFWESEDITENTDLNVDPDKWHTVGAVNQRYWPPPKKHNFFKTYKMFYEKFKGFKNAHADAECAGPSFAIFNETHFREFFDFCLNNKDQNGNPNPLEVNVVTWHELNFIFDSNAIKRLRNHVAFIRDNFVNNPKYESLNIKSIDINEIVGEQYRHNPAVQAYYLGALEESGVDHASKSSWKVVTDISASGEDNRLGNLFNRAGQKRANWWVYKLYSDGVDGRVKSYNEEIRSVVIASKETTNIPYKQILFGYTDGEGILQVSGNYKFNLKHVGTPNSDVNISFYEIPNPQNETDFIGPLDLNNQSYPPALFPDSENMISQLDSNGDISFYLSDLSPYSNPPILAKKNNLYQIVISVPSYTPIKY